MDCTAELRPYLSIVERAIRVVEGLGLVVDVSSGRRGDDTVVLVVPDKSKSTYTIKVRTSTGTASATSVGGRGIFVLKMKTNRKFTWQEQQQKGTSQGGWKQHGAVAETELRREHTLYTEVQMLNRDVRNQGGIDGRTWYEKERALLALAKEKRESEVQATEDVAGTKVKFPNSHKNKKSNSQIPNNKKSNSQIHVVFLVRDTSSTCTSTTSGSRTCTSTTASTSTCTSSCCPNRR